MPIYQIDNKIVPIQRKIIADLYLYEQRNLRTLLKTQIEVISQDTLIIAEEIEEWDDSQKIDLLGIDKSANLVVIKLLPKNDDHIHLKSIQRASIASTLNFEKIVDFHQSYLDKTGIKGEAATRILGFLGWTILDENIFAKKVRIVLASEDFSREQTSTVMWLNKYGLDIRCVRINLYPYNEQTLVDIQTIIPIPDFGSNYQVPKEHTNTSKIDKKSGKKMKYDVIIDGQYFHSQTKRGTMFRLVSKILQSGITPQQVIDAIPSRKNKLFHVIEGRVSGEQAYQEIIKKYRGFKFPNAKRYFCKDNEVFYIEGKTYLLTNQWSDKTFDAVNFLKEAFPHLKITVKPTESSD